MGHDYIDYGDRSIHLKDWDIWTLRHFFCRVTQESQAAELSTDDTTLDSLRRFFENWDWIGPGIVVGTDLTTFVLNDANRKSVLVAALDKTGALISGFGKCIPLEYLQQHVNTPMSYFLVAQPTQRFLDAIANMQKMLCEPDSSLPPHG